MESSRRHFLKRTAASSIGLGAYAALPLGASDSGKPLVTEPAPRAKRARSVQSLTTDPTETVRIAVIGLGRGMTLLDGALRCDFAEITVLCDLREERCAQGLKMVTDRGRPAPAVIRGDEDAWEAIGQRDDVDVVVIATPWNWHVPMATSIMKAGKHAFVEVSAAVTLAECWDLVDTSELTQRHCVILENCCYGESELLVLNLVREGVFGDLTHGEAAYIHDLRAGLMSGGWRRLYHTQFDGNLYPTHGLGPIAQSMGINRGDRFKFVVSVSSPERALSKWRKEKIKDGRFADETYITGDMNTSIIKTELGRSIMVQHDVVSPRPYSRINLLSGTDATFSGFPDRLALDDPKRYGLETSSHQWLSEDEFAKMREKFRHPLLKRLAETASGSGHGGMDAVMMLRHLECIRDGKTPDSTVYDAAAWSSIIELSTRSVAAGSAPMDIPDFTRGGWRELAPLPIVS